MIKKPAPAGFFIAFDLALPQRQAPVDRPITTVNKACNQIGKAKGVDTLYWL